MRLYESVLEKQVARHAAPAVQQPVYGAFWACRACRRLTDWLSGYQPQHQPQQQSYSGSPAYLLADLMSF
jgi:hypothetical protein